MRLSKKLKNLSEGAKIALKLKWLILVLFIGLTLFNTHCASVQQPMGGPKDSIPPKILSESPTNLTRNFEEEEIVIEFDEYIKLQNEFKEISITPDMDKLPTYKVRKRSLIITLPDSLEEKTTYTINFGKAIGDYNEGNPLLNYSYVFATGDEIDSLNVSGNVTNALSLEKEEEATVLLIPTRQDSIFGKRKANIFTLTDSSGNFNLKNLKEDTYRIYALKEQNGDRIYNSDDEEIGFLIDSFHLNKDTNNIKLTVSKAIPPKFRLVDRKIEKNGTITFSFNKPLDNPDIRIVKPEDLNENKLISYSSKKDSATMWLSELTFDSLKVQFYDHNELLDSVNIRRSRNEKYDRDLIITDNLNGQKVNKIKHIILQSTAPIKSVNKQNIVLTEDSIARKNFQLTADTNDNKKYILRYNWRAKRNYELVLKEDAFQGYFGEKSKDVTRKFTLDETENFGDIILQVNVPDTIGNQYLIQITNDKKDRIFESRAVRKSERLIFKQFPGGKYLIRAVYDKNKNNKWDPVNVEKRTLPEIIWYHEKIITVRPNWEQEEPIDIPPLDDN
ncbi:Ig-like domain-containing protein [Olivibacter sp. SDN3]|uniref:Ig-like domain-containing protein n=1 Tax=Olivibacter sp. SDN3 TaxID=2764720 RepID=UPI001651698C|nr:Ig-like domain-containing protein [Olivibacter sp. SDN3]QNL51113.1 Ig-like domain-containing protein [Olivibacter sp. SDN3]